MNLNERIADCRREGLSKIETIRDFVATYGLTLEQAQWLVHISPVWVDVRARDEALQDAFFNALETDN
jgi:hypothetical protein